MWSHGTQKEGMMPVFAELLPASRLVPIFLGTLDSSFNLMASKIQELPPQEREEARIALKRILEGELAKLSSFTKKKGHLKAATDITS